MGLAVCRRYCSCCPCACCHQTDSSPSQTQNKHRTDSRGDRIMTIPSPITTAGDSALGCDRKPTFKSFHPAASAQWITPDETRRKDAQNTAADLTARIEGTDNRAFEGSPDHEEIGVPSEGVETEKFHRCGTPEPKYNSKKEQSPETEAQGRGETTRTGPRALRRHARSKVSKYSYQARSLGDLDVQKGDKLEVVESKGEWLLAKKTEANGEVKTGYIPKDFLADSGSLEAEDWYYGSINRLDAKRCLLQEENTTGSFLVWKNEVAACYYLSVRLDTVVRHYKIKQSGPFFFLVERASFQTIAGLVQYYQEQSDGLCTQLGKPCVKLDLPSLSSLSHTTVDQLEIKPKSIEKVRKLGKGMFGQVWLGKWNGTTEVAIKELQVSAESLKATLQKEAEIMWKLNHERLLKLYAVCLQARPVFIVTEYMKHGTLKQFLKDHQKDRDLALPQLMDFAVQIAQGMDYMEHKGCVHRDLRSENILLSAMMSCKIGDFGLARFMDSSSIDVSADAKIPIKWMAPEVFQCQKYSSKSDVWSFGVLLVEIITYGRLPFPEKTNEQYVKDIVAGKPLEPPINCPEEVSYIMNMCWRQSYITRPSFSEIELLFMDLLNPMLTEDTVELTNLQEHTTT